MMLLLLQHSCGSFFLSPQPLFSIHQLHPDRKPQDEAEMCLYRAGVHTMCFHFLLSLLISPSARSNVMVLPFPATRPTLPCLLSNDDEAHALNPNARRGRFTI